ncbi:MAG: efflux RND transporter periplasmic adaptor subunit [Pseudomonadota bacterium]|nr:efflux RND transporter periplasmic adaptor subunit [Pseudomonadota bacterium]
MNPRTPRATSPLDIAERWNAWMRALTLVLSIAITAIVLTACGRAGDEDKGGKGGFPPAPVSVQEVKTTTVPIRFEYVGQTAGSKEAEVRARVQGILEKRTYQEGSRVNAGQTLFVLDSRPYAAQLQAAEADLSRAQAQYSQAKRNIDRVKPLAGSNALSQREFDEATSGEETGAAAIKQAQARLTEARLNLGYTRVTAPVAGWASRAQKSEGSLVSPGADSLLATISQLDPLYVNFSVSEAERLRLNRLMNSGELRAPAANGATTKNGSKAAGPLSAGDKSPLSGYSVALKLSDGSVYDRKGRLTFVDPAINTGTGSFDARAELPNADAALRPGQFVRVIVEGATRPNTIVVPQRAVMDGPQGKFVFVTGKGQDGKTDVALPRPVTVGEWVEVDGQQQWIVETGLKPGDVVVTDGTAKLFPIPGGAPIMLGPPPGMEGKGPPPGGKGEIKKADAKK